MARFLTFTFDDGFMAGARKAAELLSPDKGTFFVVSNWVLRKARHHVAELADRDFGSPDAWRALAQHGHDIQAHSAAHVRYSQMTDAEQVVDAAESFDLVRAIHSGPYIFCCPYNVLPETFDFGAAGFSAAGFRSTPSDKPVVFNRLDAVDLFRLHRWAVRETHLERLQSELESVPDQTWTILGLHSLDGEGFEPWSSEAFHKLVAVARAANFRIATTREMVSRIADPALA